MAFSPCFRSALAEKVYHKRRAKARKNPSSGVKNSRGGRLCTFFGEKNKKATLSRGRTNGSQRSLTICVVLPKIISSTSCLMNLSNILCFTLLSLFNFSLYYRREKCKFQWSAFMVLTKKLTVISCNVPNGHLHFCKRYFIIGYKLIFETEDARNGGVRHI